MRRLPLAAALALLAGCHDGGSGPSGAGPGPGGSGFTAAEIWLGRGPADDLSSFAATLTGLRLVRSATGLTGDLLLLDARVELVGLGAERVALVRGTIPAGVYFGAELDFEPGTLVARGDDGFERALTSADGTLRVSLDANFDAVDDGFARFVIDLDLADSLVPDGLGGLEFSPVGRASADEGAVALAAAEVEGTVGPIDEPAGSFALDVPSGGLTPAFERRTVTVPPDVITLLGGEVVADDPAFLFAELVPGVTQVRVRGASVGREGLLARRVEVEPSAGVFGAELAVRGTVQEAGPGEFVLLVRSVARGDSVLEPLLAAVGPELAFVYDDLTPILDGGARAAGEDLAAGQELLVEVCAPPGGPPFGACRIEIARRASAFEGVLAAADPPFAEASVRCESGEAVLRAGLVASEVVDVRVPLARVRVDVPGLPELDPSALVPELRVRVLGRITGSPFAPEVEEAELLVLPGRLLDAELVELVGVTRFTVDGGRLLGPFGQGLAPGPLDVVIDPACVFAGLVHDRDTFLAFLDAFGDNLAIDVRGIVGGPNELRAFALRLH